jgi:carboxylesterase
VQSLRDFQLRLSRRLLSWALPSAAGGLALALGGSEPWQAFGIQAAVWGGVDAVIALLGRRSALKKRQPAPAGHNEAAAGNDETATPKAQARRLRRILWVNAALDVLYVAGGLALALTLGRQSGAAFGHGAGIALQGSFLLVFDVIHAQAVPPPPPTHDFQSFRDPGHHSFLLPGGEPAALLVHGFPGTPAEMLPLGRLLHQQGWTVRGLLLPGFGPEFPGLLGMPQERWREAVVEGLSELRREHRPVLLAGYSLGGALAIAAARREPPDALLLLAPFWRLGTALQRFAGTALRPFLPQYLRLFAEADFADPELRRSLGEFFPDNDLDDPALQAEIRELVVPLSLLKQLARAGRQAYRDVAGLDAPVLVLQGREDRLAQPESTRRLAARFPRADGGKDLVVELPGGHRLLDEGSPGWDTLRGAVARFAESVVMKPGAARHDAAEKLERRDPESAP